jgi:hypothetical protein
LRGSGPPNHARTNDGDGESIEGVELDCEGIVIIGRKRAKIRPASVRAPAGRE